MTLLSEEQKQKLQKLYSQKKYLELELEVESISDFKSRSSFLANLLGVVKLKKTVKKEQDWIDARELFLDSYNKAPDYYDALCNYAHVCVKLRDYSHAFKELLEKKKKGYSPKINEALARIYFFEGEIDKEVELFKENEKNDHLTPATASHLLTSMNYSSNFDQQEYLDYCRKIDKKFSFSKNELNKLNKYNLDDDLRIGFISPDLKEHSVYYFLKTIIDPLKRNSIKVIAFNLRNEAELDDISTQIKNECDEWHDLSRINDLDAANLIISKKVNVLIDLCGHFARNRFRILKYKPAPVQALWMGYVNSSGIKEIDYLIADDKLIKKDEENQYIEKVLKLPNIWNCHSGINVNLSVEDLPYKKNGFITFGCFNNSTKISENCINLWSKILNEIKNSKLIIKAQSKDSEIAQYKILEKFQFNKVDKKRIIFEGHKKDKKDHLKNYNLVDLSLDTFPYPGVTTSFESIWMGVPVLTKKGNNFVSRCGASIMENAGLTEFIANDEEDYFNKAISFANDIEKLDTIRKNLREKTKNSPLFDAETFGNDFSKLVKEMWANYGSNKNNK